MTEALNTLTKLSEFATIPAVVVMALKWHKLSQSQRYLALMIVVITINQLLASSLLGLSEGNNLPLYHIYILVEGPALLLLYRKRFKEEQIRKNLTRVAYLLISVVLGNALFIQGWNNLPTFSRTLEAVILVALALYYLRYIFKEQKIKYLSVSFWFWLSSGLLIYFSSNLLLFIFTNVVKEGADELFVGVWSIHAALNFVLYGFYSIAFLCLDQEYYHSS